MKKYTEEDIEKIPKQTLLKLIALGKKHIKKTKVVKDMFDSSGVDIAYIDVTPIYFKHLDVSAQTVKGVIYLNYKLLSDKPFNNSLQYIVHELTHLLSQITGDKATENTDDLEGEDYLGSPEELAAFKNQVAYMEDQFGEEEAEKYVEHLLNYHDIEEDEKEDIKDKLLD